MASQPFTSSLIQDSGATAPHSLPEQSPARTAGGESRIPNPYTEGVLTGLVVPSNPHRTQTSPPPLGFGLESAGPPKRELSTTATGGTAGRPCYVAQ